MLASFFQEDPLHTLLPLLILLTLCSCENSPPQLSEPWQLIAGRNEDKEPIYQSIVPTHWQKMATELDLNDTMKPLCAYLIEEELRLVVHNFPSNSLSDRIPPQAQVLRWQRQSGQGIVANECHNGFNGLRFEADNVLAWAMQLDPEHYLTLTGPTSTSLDYQRRADYTIKVTGPQELMDIHRPEIESFVRHFELVEPITTDS